MAITCSGIGTVADADLDVDGAERVAVRPVEHAARDQLGVRHDQARAIEGLDLGGAHADAAHEALLVADDDAVADLDRPLDQQDQPRDEVVDDRLQAEADADRQGAGDDGEIGDVEAGIGDRHQRRERDADVAHHRVDGIGDARVQAAIAADRSRSQRWNSRVANSSAMNSTMPARMRTSENLNWPISMPNSSDVSHSRMSAPEKPHCSIRNGSAPMTEREGQRQLGQARQLAAARRVQSEPLLEQVADRNAVPRRLAGDGANGQIAEPGQKHDEARQHQLLGDEARQRHVAEQRRGDDADGDHPQRYLEPARRHGVRQAPPASLAG